MVKSKVFDVFKGLTKEELKKFSDYLRSPLFNKRKVILELFNVYKNYYPDFSDKNLTKEKVFSKICPGKKYNDEILRNLNSILLKHAEDFLSYVNYSNDSLTVKKHLLSEINRRKILKIFEKNFEESRRILESSEEKDLNFFYYEYDLFLQKDIYNSIIINFSKDDIVRSEKNLLIFFMIELLQIQNYILYQCRLLGLDKSVYLKDTFVDELLKKMPIEITQMPQIRIYYNALKLEQTNHERYYVNLKLLLGQYGNMISREKLYNKYLEMIDYIKRTRPPKDLRTTSELFQLRKEIIEKDLLIEKTIKNMFFLNFVKSGLKLKKFEWIYNFINNYKSYLIPKYRDIITDLSLALFHFEKGEFGKSLSYAAQIRYEDNFYNLEVKNLTARIYFEMNETELLISFVNSYKMYLSKNRSIDSKTNQSHSDFISNISKLIKIKELKKFYKLDDLSNQIDKKDFVNRHWITEKINELM
ncbi:MAG: hypothetical protein M3R36_05055 [Bacteroidota bacterium]|nr:hypothetical protein [Bacteroidota bacterium]